MLRKRLSLWTSAITWIVAIGITFGADWKQWRGEGRQGHSPDTGLLKKWPEEGPKRVWLFKDCGKGYSAPSIADGKIYILGARDDMAQLICLSEEKGEELWATELDVIYGNRWGDGPRGTPTIDGDRVYALAGKGALVCAKADDVSATKAKAARSRFMALYSG